MQPSYFSEIGTSPRSALACGPLSLDLSPPTLKQEIFYVQGECVNHYTMESQTFLFLFLFFCEDIK